MLTSCPIVGPIASSRNPKICTICNRMFSKKNSLMNHVQYECLGQQLDQGSSYYKCSICAADFTRALHLQEHMLNIHQVQIHPCMKCHRKYKNRKHLIRHLRDECGVDPKFLCPHCPYRCKHKQALKSHIRYRHLNKRFWEFWNLDGKLNSIISLHCVCGL